MYYKSLSAKTNISMCQLMKGLSRMEICVETDYTQVGLKTFLYYYYGFVALVLVRFWLQ